MGEGLFTVVLLLVAVVRVFVGLRLMHVVGSASCELLVDC